MKDSKAINTRTKEQMSILRARYWVEYRSRAAFSEAREACGSAHEFTIFRSVCFSLYLFLIGNISYIVWGQLASQNSKLGVEITL
jgi:hypothetical protein